jgi:hypothetical protein
MYIGDGVKDILISLIADRNFSENNPWEHTTVFDSSVSNSTLLWGYTPIQTRKERIQEILFVNNYTIEGLFSRVWTIKQQSDNTEGRIVPVSKTFSHPTVKMERGANSIKVISYYFDAREPQDGEKYVYAGIPVAGSDIPYFTNWVYTEIEHTANNPSYGGREDSSDVSIECMLVDGNKASDLLDALQDYYFNPVTVEAEIVNNNTYKLGQKLRVYTEEDVMYEGYVTGMSYSFGNQAKTRITLSQCTKLETAKVTRTFVCNALDGAVVGKRVHYLPPRNNYYIIANPDLHIHCGGEFYTLSPVNETMLINVPTTSAVSATAYYTIDE